MEETKNEQAISQTVQATEVESDGGAEKAEASFGKFKDAESLLKAYNSLNAEFTKRCQKIKELEVKISEKEKDAPCEQQTNPLSITDEKKEEILKDYLKEVLSSKTKAIVMDGNGMGLKTPPTKPRTIEEAGKLVREIFSK